MSINNKVIIIKGGVPITDNQDFLTVGTRGPLLHRDRECASIRTE